MVQVNRGRGKASEQSTATPAGEILALRSTILREYLQLVLRTMMTFAAKMGNVQLYDPAKCSLVIVSEWGFGQDFLTFFDRTHQGQAACGTALLKRERIVVEDVATSPIFTKTEAREVLLGAGVRAVQSTPLLTSSGDPLGVISSHYTSPGRPSDGELRLIDRVVRSSANLIERTFRFQTAWAGGPLRQAEIMRNSYQLFYRIGECADLVETIVGKDQAIRRLRESSLESRAEFVLLHESNVIAVAKRGVVDLDERQFTYSSEI